jgi:hypothetical protein
MRKQWFGFPTTWFEVTGVLGVHSWLCGSLIVLEVSKKLAAYIFRVISIFTAARLAVNTPLPRLLADELYKLYISQINNFWKKKRFAGFLSFWIKQGSHDLSFSGLQGNLPLIKDHAVTHVIKNNLIPQMQPQTGGFLKTKASDATWHPYVGFVLPMNYVRYSRSM